jgi:hypothetical protein
MAAWPAGAHHCMRRRATTCGQRPRGPAPGACEHWRSPWRRFSQECAARPAPPAAIPSRRARAGAAPAARPRHQRAGPAHSSAAPGPHRRIVGLLQQPRQVEPVALQVGQRHVDAAARQVHAQVLPEVDQLQRAADGVGLAQRRRVADAVQVQQQPPDRVGRAAAVVQQLRAVGVARVAHVLLEGVEQGMQPALAAAHAREWPSASAGNTAGQRGLGGGRPAPLAGRRGRPQVGQRCAGAHRLRRPGRRPCGQSGRSPPRPGAARRAQQRCDREVLVMLDATACIVHGHAPNERSAPGADHVGEGLWPALLYY